MIEKTNHFPKILVVSAAPISPTDATGITLTNLFSGWPVDCIAQIYDSPRNPDESLCKNNWRISNDENRIVHFAKNLRQKIRKFVKKSNSDLPVNLIQKITITNDLSFFAAVADVMPFSLADDLVEWIEKYSPDVIYTLLGNSRICGLVNKISKHQGIPIVPHFMDDWPSNLYQSQKLKFFFRKILSLRLNKALEYSSQCLAIGSGMANEMSYRYNKKFSYFMNCVECQPYEKPKHSEKEKTIRFGYVGGLHLNRWCNLLSLAKVIHKIELAETKITLSICAPLEDVKRFSSKFNSFKSICDFSSVPLENVPDVLRSFDVLVHVESFFQQDTVYTRLSVSTKIPQYMASGRPILAIGPENISSISYVNECEAGLTVTEDGNFKILTEKVLQLATSEDLREALALKGYDVALNCHNAKSERARFASVMSNAASGGKN